MIAYALLVAKTVVESSSVEASWVDMLSRVVTWLSLAAIAFRVSTQRLSHRPAVGLVAAGGLVFMSMANSRHDGLLLTFGFVLAAHGIAYRKFVKAAFCVLAALVPLVVVAARAGLIEEGFFTRDGQTVRSALGFAHPNTLGRMALQITLCWIVIRWDRLNLAEHLVILGGAFAIDSLADSRTSVFLILVALAARWICHRGGYVGARIVVGAAKVAIVLAPALSLLLAVTFDPASNWQRWLDDALSFRLQWMSFFYQRNGFALFGQEVDFGAPHSFSVGNYVLDNAFVLFAVRDGVVLLALVIVGMWISIERLAARRDMAAVTCVLIVFLYGITENIVINVAFNFTLLAIASILPSSSASGNGREPPSTRDQRGSSGFSRYDVPRRAVRTPYTSRMGRSRRSCLG